VNKALREKIIAENKACRAVESLFEEYEQRTGVRLKNDLKAVFEGVPPHNRLTKNFKSHFDSYVEMENYFKKALA